MEFISVGYESTKYLINRLVLQEVGSVLEGVWLWRISGVNHRWKCKFCKL